MKEYNILLMQHFTVTIITNLFLTLLCHNGNYCGWYLRWNVAWLDTVEQNESCDLKWKYSTIKSLGNNNFTGIMVSGIWLFLWNYSKLKKTITFKCIENDPNII